MYLLMFNVLFVSWWDMSSIVPLGKREREKERELFIIFLVYTICYGLFTLSLCVIAML